MVNQVIVCGAGTMGSGIAQLSAQSGLNTILYDVKAEMLPKAQQAINNNIGSLVEKGKLSKDHAEMTQARLRYTSRLADCTGDIIIEAIIEKAEAKIDLFRQLALVNTPSAIFASNTSSLPVDSIAEKVPEPERFVGMHFFNPAPVMKLVEIVKSKYTGDHTCEMVIGLAKQMGKTPVVCRDSPGFIVNRVARPYYIESLRLIEEDLSSFMQIDRLLEASGFRMGPFKLMDLIGNDVNYAVSTSVYEQLNKPARLQPSSIQKEKVSQGALGRKSGKGYYDYS